MSPDLDKVQERYRNLLEYYGGLRSRWDEDEHYYKGDFEFTLPDTANKIVPATGRNAIDIPSTHLITEKPMVKRRRELRGVKEAEEEDDVESFCMAFLKYNERMAETPPLHDAGKFQFLRGQAILLGPLFNLKAWQAGKERFLWYDAVDPKIVLMEPGPYPREVFLVYEVTAAEAEQLAERHTEFKGFEIGTRRNIDRVTLVQWYGFTSPKDKICWKGAWDDGLEHGSTWITSPKPSGYPYLPVGRIYSGYGLRSLGADPKDVSVSILNEQFKSLLKDQAFAISVCSSVMGISAWERYKLPPELAATLGLLMKVDYAPGSVSWIPPEAIRIDAPEVPAAVLQYYGYLQGLLEEASFSGVIGGQRPTGVDTASGLAILSGQARLKFGPPLRLLQAGVGRMLGKVGLLMGALEDIMGEPVTFEIEGRRVTSRQWQDDFGLEVDLLAEDPEDANMRITRGLTLWGKMSERKIHADFFRNENYEEDLIQRLYEQIVQSDEMRQTLAEYLQIARGPMGQQPAGTPGQAPRPSGLTELGQLNTMARLMRASRPGTLQQPAPPGSPEQAALQARGMMRGIAGFGQGRG